jgi:hypothetical protein
MNVRKLDKISIYGHSDHGNEIASHEETSSSSREATLVLRLTPIVPSPFACRSDCGNGFELFDELFASDGEILFQFPDRAAVPVLARHSLPRLLFRRHQPRS